MQWQAAADIDFTEAMVLLRAAKRNDDMAREDPELNGLKKVASAYRARAMGLVADGLDEPVG
jgi:hypothetical protein